MKKNIFILLIITLVGFLLRIWYIQKPEGLWNDEYVSWFIASKPIFNGFLSEMIKNCHMPLYYIYLKVWMFLFSDTDLSLRVSSVLLGVLSIISMYFVGKEFKDTKLGLYCAGFTALSGFLIYFSQEVRLYSLLFLITSICIFMSLYLTKNQSSRNFILWGISNLLIVMTHSIGFIFVILNMIGMGFYLYKQDKKYLKPVVTTFIIVFMLLTPLVPFLYNIFTSSYISQFWSGFSFAKVFFVLADYLSPIQVNILTTPKQIVNMFYNNGSVNYMYIIFAMIPASLAFSALIYSLFQKDQRVKYMISISALYFGALVIAALLGKLVLITKYCVEIYPILILLVCYGIYSIKKAYIRNIFIYTLIVLPLFFYIVNKNSTPKLGRTEGNKIVTELLKAANIKSTDTVLLTYYNAERFEKYMNNVHYQIESIDKYNFQYFMAHERPLHRECIEKGKTLYLNYFEQNENREFDEIFNDAFIKDLNKGDKIALVFLKTVSFFNTNEIKLIAENPQKYKETPLLFLIFSYIKNNSVALCNQKLKLQLIIDSGDWELYVFEKL